MQPPTTRPTAARRTTRAAALVVPALLALLTTTGCATNPATGKQQLSLYSEAQEIEIGRGADPQIVGQYGLVDDDELRNYVDRVGQKLAATSERPNLPWTFRVLDDPVVNAFALPGGFIYVTRGILAHMGSEAELAAVLGHEIGHVTARHGVNRMSKATLAQIGLGVGMVAAPEMRGVLGDLAGAGLQLLFLQYSRDDERQADDLGFRYLDRGVYPPGAFADVFQTLAATSRKAGGGQRLPTYLATHPHPEERLAGAQGRLADLPADVRDRPWRREPYVALLDGMVFGPNPRNGFFRGRDFVHPDLALRMTLPAGWTAHNQTQALVVVSPNNDALFQLTIAGEPNVDAAARAFYNQQGLEIGSSWSARSDPALQASRFFVANPQTQNPLYGAAAFSEYDGRVYRLLAIATSDAWRPNQNALKDTMESFRVLRDRDFLRVQPQRIDLVTIDRAMDIEEFQRRYPSDLAIQDLAILNQVELGTKMERGRKVKRVRGFDAGPQTGVTLH